MSWIECPQADTSAAASQADPIELVVVPRTRDLGGFEVRRALPSGRRRMVGPFIFFDQMGPALLRAGSGLDVRPHPHIGLATVTYLIAGELHRARSPVPTFSETLYADIELAAGAVLPVGATHEERAIYIAAGEIELAGRRHAAGRLLVLRPGDALAVTAVQAARLLLLGGEPMDGPRFIWWNFVSSRQERIEQAKADWQAGRFAPVPGDDEFIPLP